MDAANQQAHDNTMILLRGVLSGGRDDLVELFEKHAERGPDDELYIRVDTAADLVLDMGAGETGAEPEPHDARNGRPAPHVDFGEPTCRGCAGPVYLPGLTYADDLPLCTAHWNQWLTRFLGADDAPPCRAHLIHESRDVEVDQ